MSRPKRSQRIKPRGAGEREVRLSSYPYVVVRVGCTKCPRAGAYRLARLADKYGAEAQMISVLAMLSGDCKRAERGRPGIDRCGAFFPDLGRVRPSDKPVVVGES